MAWRWSATQPSVLALACRWIERRTSRLVPAKRAGGDHASATMRSSRSTRAAHRGLHAGAGACSVLLGRRRRSGKTRSLRPERFQPTRRADPLHRGPEQVGREVRPARSSGAAPDGEEFSIEVHHAAEAVGRRCTRSSARHHGTATRGRSARSSRAQQAAGEPRRPTARRTSSCDAVARAPTPLRRVAIWADCSEGRSDSHHRSRPKPRPHTR